MEQLQSSVYLQYEHDLLRIAPRPSKLILKQDPEHLGNWTDPSTGFPYGFKPSVGFGWATTDIFVLDRKAKIILLSPADLPSEADWKQSGVFKDETGNAYMLYKAVKYFLQPIKIQSLLVDKYDALAKYFGQLTVVDVESFSEEEFVETVQYKHRLLMRSFYRNELCKLPQSRIEYVQCAEVQPAQLTIVQRRVVLDLRQKAVSLQFANSLPTQIPVNKLVEKMKLKNLNPQFTLDICLANCFLRDDDMQYVEQLLQYFVKCQRLDLSGNRICGSESQADTMLLAMLDEGKYPQLEYVDVVRNPVASIENKELFESLTSSQLERLIWVPAAWIEGATWRTMVKPEMYDTVIQAHKKYYAIA